MEASKMDNEETEASEWEMLSVAMTAVFLLTLASIPIALIIFLFGQLARIATTLFF